MFCVSLQPEALKPRFSSRTSLARIIERKKVRRMHDMHELYVVLFAYYPTESCRDNYGAVEESLLFINGLRVILSRRSRF